MGSTLADAFAAVAPLYPDGMNKRSCAMWQDRCVMLSLHLQLGGRDHELRSAHAVLSVRLYILQSEGLAVHPIHSLLHHDYIHTIYIRWPPRVYFFLILMQS